MKADLPRFSPDPKEKVVEPTFDPVSNRLLVRADDTAAWFYDLDTRKLEEKVRLPNESRLVGLRPDPGGEHLYAVSVYDLLVYRRDTREEVLRRNLNLPRYGIIIRGNVTTHERYFEASATTLAYSDGWGRLVHVELGSGELTHESIAGVGARQPTMIRHPDDRDYLPPPAATPARVDLLELGEGPRWKFNLSAQFLSCHGSADRLPLTWAKRVGRPLPERREVVVVGRGRLAIVALDTLTERPIALSGRSTPSNPRHAPLYAGWFGSSGARVYWATRREIFIAELAGDDARVRSVNVGFPIVGLLPLPDRDAFVVGGIMGVLAMVPLDAMTD